MPRHATNERPTEGAHREVVAVWGRQPNRRAPTRATAVIGYHVAPVTKFDASMAYAAGRAKVFLRGEAYKVVSTGAIRPTFGTPGYFPNQTTQKNDTPEMPPLPPAPLSFQRIL